MYLVGPLARSSVRNPTACKCLTTRCTIGGTVCVQPHDNKRQATSACAQQQSRGKGRTGLGFGWVARVGDQHVDVTALCSPTAVRAAHSAHHFRVLGSWQRSGDSTTKRRQQGGLRPHARRQQPRSRVLCCRRGTLTARWTSLMIRRSNSSISARGIFVSKSRTYLRPTSCAAFNLA